MNENKGGWNRKTKAENKGGWNRIFVAEKRGSLCVCSFLCILCLFVARNNSTRNRSFAGHEKARKDTKESQDRDLIGNQRRDTTLCRNPSELEAWWRAPAFTKDILRMVGIGKLDFSTPLHAIMLCPQLPGSSNRPADSAGLFESEFNGQVPGAKSRTSGRGRGSMRSRENMENETGMVADSIMEEPGKSQRWQDEAKKQLESAKNVPAVREGTVSEREAAKMLLARKMREQVTAEAMSSTEGVYQDLVSTSLNRVDFEELAEEVIRSSLESR